jgi:hypothetical protein
MIGAATVAGRRDVRLDVLRGLFIVSMGFSHLALGSNVSNAIHPFLWVDGAYGFVLCSGVALALSRRRQVFCGHAGEAHRWIAKRTVTLWGVAVGLSAAALMLKAISHSPQFMWPRVDGARDVLHALPGVLVLATQPDYLDILPPYVALLLLAQPALWLCRRGRTVLMLLGSIALYVVAEVGLLDRAPDVGNAVRWPSWQLLFIGGMAIGWHWEEVTSFLARRRVPVVLASGVVAIAVLLAAHGAFPPLARTFDKNGMSPTTVVAGAAVLVVGLLLVGTLLEARVAPVLAPLASLGRHSLGCFITLTVIQVLALTVGHPRTLMLSMHLGVAFAGLAVCFAVAWIADRARADRPAMSTPLVLASPGHET